MKIPSTFLHDLVLTLTKSEKRYVKVQAGTRSKDYIELLDALLAQKTYDEAKLIKDNEGANFLKYLAVNKRYLYDLLLKLLAQFGQKAIEDQVQERLAATKALMKKGLMTPALKELEKGQKLAAKYELFEWQIMLCGLQKKLSSKQKRVKLEENASRQLFELERNALVQLTNINEYWYLAQRVARFQMRFQKVQTEKQQQHLIDLSQSEEFVDLNLATNFRSKLYFYQANATYRFIKGEVKKAYEVNSEFLDLLEANPHFLSLYSENYLATLNNMLIDSLVIKDYEVLKTGISRLEMTLKRPEFKSMKNMESRVFRQRYLLLINWSLSQKDFGSTLEWIPEIEAGLQRFGEKIEKHHRITFYYLLAYLLFLNKRCDKALVWINLILNDGKEDVVKEIYYFARILNLLIHFELGNTALLGSLLLSTPKYLKPRRPVYLTEKTLFRFLTKFLAEPNKKERDELVCNFKTEVDRLAQKPSERRVFNYLDLRLWEMDAL
ncbi:MAG: hypothetical protein AB8H12_16150 [Lewinella sp.]